MKNNQTYDAVIVGSGIAGLGAAYALIKRRKKILLLSPHKPLKGESTPASAGILDPFLESAQPRHPFFELKKKAFLKLPGQFQRIERESGLKTGYEKTGMIFAALNGAEEKKLKKRLRSHQPSGIPVKWVEREQALQRWPYLSCDIRGVLFYPTLGRVFPAWLQKALIRIVTRRGGRKASSRGPVKLLVEKGQVAGVTFDGKTIKSSIVINAGGCWADQACVSPLRMPIYPVRGQVLIVGGKRHAMKTVVHSAGGVYMVPWIQGTCFLGATVENAGFKARVKPEVLRKIYRDAAKMLPELNRLSPMRTWAGLRPCSKDRLPVLGKTAIKGYYMASGYYRSGVVISLYAGELLAEGVFGKGFAREMEPFSPMRFKR